MVLIAHLDALNATAVDMGALRLGVVPRAHPILPLGVTEEQGVEIAAFHGRADTSEAAVRPRSLHVAAIAMQEQALIAVVGGDLLGQLQRVQLLDSARGQAIAASFIAGEGGGVDKQHGAPRMGGMIGGRGTGGARAHDQNVYCNIRMGHAPIVALKWASTVDSPRT